MGILFFLTELLGTVSFAVSGAIIGMKKNMDIFGIVILGVVTAVGGGVMRDIALGNVPPIMFQNSVYSIVAAIAAIVVCIPGVFGLLNKNQKVFDTVMLIADTFGLGIFSVIGVRYAYSAGGDNLFLAVFVGTITGVGGGVLRDVLSCSIPYVFVKHIYALAAITGSVVCAALWNLVGEKAAMFIGAAVIFLIRFLAAYFRWSLPHPKNIK